MTKQVIIETSNDAVVLKQFIKEDAEPLFALIDCNRSHLSQFEDETADKYPSQQSVLDSIANFSLSRLRLGIWWNDILVGTVNAQVKQQCESMSEDTFVIECWIGSRFCGKGFATTATKAIIEYYFAQDQFNLAYAWAHKDNHASIRVLKKAGLEIETTTDDYVYLSKEKE